MVLVAAGRPRQYDFLIKRLVDSNIYCAASVAHLLIPRDLSKFGGNGDLVTLRFRARQSLARIARLSGFSPCGLDSCRHSKTRNAYPGFKGRVWKQILAEHEKNQNKNHALKHGKHLLKILHGA